MIIEINATLLRGINMKGQILSMETIGANSLDCKTFWVTEKGAFGETYTLTWEFDEVIHMGDNILKDILTAIKSGKNYCNPKHTGIIEIQWD